MASEGYGSKACGVVGNMAGRPEYTYETASRSWAQARERRDNARAEFEQAERALDEANRAETEAWKVLVNESGRASPEPSDVQAPKGRWVP